MNPASPLASIVTDPHAVEGSPSPATQETFGPQLVQLAVETAGLGVWEWDLVRDSFRGSERCRELLGIGEAVANLEEVLHHIHPDDHPLLGGLINGSLDSGRDEAGRIQFRALLADGSVRWLEANGRVLFEKPNGQPMPVRSVGTLADITEQKRRELDLQRVTSDLDGRVREAQCLSSVSRLLFQPEAQVAEVLGQLPAVISRGWSHPELCVVQITVEHSRYATPGYRHSECQLRAPIAAGGELLGELQVGYMDGAAADPPSFLPEEEQLIADLADRIGSFVHRHAVEEELRRAEERFRSTFEQAAVGILHVDMQGHFQRVNRRFCDMVGYTHHELMRMTFIDLLPPEDLERAMEDARRLVHSTTTSFGGEQCYICKDGHRIWVHLTVSVVEGGPTGDRYMISVVEDITEAKAQEQELQDTRFLMEKTLTSMHEAVLVIDAATGAIRTCNPAVERLFGYPRAELIGSSAEILHMDHESFAGFRDLIQEAIRGGGDHTGECRMRCREGRVIFTDHTFARIVEDEGLVSGIVDVVRDVTARREAEENLRRREEILEAMAFISERLLRTQQMSEALPSIMMRLGQTLEADRVLLFEDSLGLDGIRCASLRAEWCMPGVPEQMSNPALQMMPLTIDPFPAWAERLDAGQAVSGHVRDLFGNGRENPLAPDVKSFLVVPVFAGSERWGALGFGSVQEREWSAAETGAVRSVADNIGSSLQRRRIVNDLRRLTTAIEQAMDAIVLTDTNGIIEYVNEAFTRVTGYPRHEAVGRDFFHLDSQSEKSGVPQDLWQTLLAGKVWDGRVPSRRADGRPYDQELSVSPARDDEGHTVQFVIVLRDITEQLRMDQQSRQSQKMEAIGQLAGGVAHDFNNLLQVIQGYSQLARRECAEDPSLADHIDQVLKASERATVLVRQLLAFGRKQIRQPQLLDLNRIIEDVMRMLRRVIGEHIRLEFELCAAPCEVIADPGQLEQVLMNLCVNARDAMPHGGQITVGTGHREISPDDCLANPWAQPGRYAFLSVKDEGTGIAPEIIDHIFEPFFTTKEMGRGTGLGLATVYGIVKQHEGLISVAGVPGGGTVFHVYLPLAEPAAGADHRDEKGEDRPGTGLVLLAEDEDLVRQLAVRILEHAGYQVLIARDGREAIELLDQHGEKVDLALLDIVMPHVSGRGVFEHIRQTRPGIPVLFTSGYSLDVLDEEMLPGESFHLIQKPYQPQALLRQVGDLIRPGER